MTGLADMNASPDPYVHSTSRWQEWTSRLFRRIPFALCGQWLAAEPGVEYPEPDGPSCPACARQVTVRQWFALPKDERRQRVAEFRAADAALQAYKPPGGEEDETYLRFNARVCDLWPTVPWWWRR